MNLSIVLKIIFLILLAVNVAIFISNYKKIQNLDRKFMIIMIYIIYGLALTVSVVYIITFVLMFKQKISTTIINLQLFLFIAMFINVMSIALISSQLSNQLSSQTN